MQQYQNFAVSMLLLLTLVPETVCADDGVFSANPYKIKVFVFFQPPVESDGASRTVFVEAIRDRCRLHFGRLCEFEFDFPVSDSAESLESRYATPPDDWESLDKIFVAEFVDRRELRLREFDVKTRYPGRKSFRSIDHPSKSADILVSALAEQLSPIAKMEKAAIDQASFRIRGADLDALTDSDGNRITSRAGITIGQSVLLPFVRSFDRNDKLIDVSRVLWTTLISEKIDPITNLLSCRVESAYRSSLGSRRRGKTEVYALSVPTPMLPTRIRLQARTVASGEEQAAKPSFGTLPIYDVLEAVPGIEKPMVIGRTQSDGTFVLEPIEDRPVRVLLIRGGRTLIAQIPVVRGLEEELPVPIPDDSVRLEAEAAFLGLQEEMIDVAARRGILKTRLDKYRQEKNNAMLGETESTMNRLKDDARFLIELDQIRLRHRSDDPVVQRRIDKMYRDTRRAIQGR